MGYVIDREYWFSAAHRLEGHPKCGRLHGHNYRVVVSVVRDDEGLENGWILDFSDLDKIVKPIVDLLDHRYIVSLSNIRAADPYYFYGRKNDMVALDLQHTTAERLASWIATKVQTGLPAGINVDWVEVQETPKSRATFYPGTAEDTDGID